MFFKLPDYYQLRSLGCYVLGKKKKFLLVDFLENTVLQSEKWMPSLPLTDSVQAYKLEE